MIVSVKETPEVARHVSDVRIGGISEYGVTHVDTDEGVVIGRRPDGNEWRTDTHLPITVMVWKEGLCGGSADEVRLHGSDIIGKGKDARIRGL